METELQLQPKDKTFSKLLLTYVFILLGFIIIAFICPNSGENFGALTLIPPLFLISYIFYTKRILEALTLASILNYVMAYKGHFFAPFNEMLLAQIMNEDIAWLFIVCGLMGSIIALIERAGGALAFGEWVAQRAKTRKTTLVWSWILGVIIFIDDYLNCLTVGSCMAPLTDRHKVSREMLAYVVDSTAAPVCTLIPISTWAIFIGSLMESNGLAGNGEGVKYFIKTIPFNFYGWIAAIITLLVVLEIVPIFGPMKAAEKRAREEGILAPPGSEKIDIKAGIEQMKFPENPKVINFFLPILFLIVSTIYFDVDMQMGVLATIAFTFLLYVPQKLMDPLEFADLAIQGIKNMLLPLVLVVLAYCFAAGCEEIGFIEYVVNSTAKIVTPQLLPLVCFLIFGMTEFIMGISWGMYIIALPIVIPLAIQIGANPAIVVGAVCSAGVWGSHICFYSDATILTSAATGCDNFRHAVTQMPFGFLGAILSVIAFLIAGFVL